MFKSLSGLFSSAPVFPYTLEEPYETSWGNWTHYRGKTKVCQPRGSQVMSRPGSYVACGCGCVWVGGSWGGLCGLRSEGGGSAAYSTVSLVSSPLVHTQVFGMLIRYNLTK
eukprot:1187813-Prorocentrum_minimum.AAC.2